MALYSTTIQGDTVHGHVQYYNIGQYYNTGVYAVHGLDMYSTTIQAYAVHGPL